MFYDNSETNEPTNHLLKGSQHFVDPLDIDFKLMCLYIALTLRTFQIGTHQSYFTCCAYVV